jgi:hypothetical protein
MIFVPLNYSSDIKAARMRVVQEALNAGRLVLYGAAKEKIAEVTLLSPSGGVFASLLHLAGSPFITQAQVSGALVEAKLFAQDGSLVVQGLTVGQFDSDLIVNRVDVEKGNLIKIDAVDLRHA